MLGIYGRVSKIELPVRSELARATGAVASVIYQTAAPFILQINAGNSNKPTAAAAAAAVVIGVGA